MTPATLPLDGDPWALVLTGAGVSAESGIPTFRDANGLWRSHPVERVASPEGFVADPALVWRFYSERRAAARPCRPNPGHDALVALERRLGDRFLLVTQNVDGLHRRAGSERVVELHGNLFRTRCSRCDRPAFDDEAEHVDELPGCGRCDARGEFALLRPHIVWFGEAIDPEHLARIDDFVRRAARSPARFLFLAAGTSGAVYPAAGLVDVARRRGADTWLVNAEPPDSVASFHHFVQGPSGTVLPALVGAASLPDAAVAGRGAGAERRRARERLGYRTPRSPGATWLPNAAVAGRDVVAERRGCRARRGCRTPRRSGAALPDAAGAGHDVVAVCRGGGRDARARARPRAAVDDMEHPAPRRRGGGTPAAGTPLAWAAPVD